MRQLHAMRGRATNVFRLVRRGDRAIRLLRHDDRMRRANRLVDCDQRLRAMRNRPGELRTRRGCRERHVPGAGLGAGPFLCGAAGYDPDIGFGLLRQELALCQPVLDALGAGIIGGGGKAEIAELHAQAAQQRRRLRQRLDRIEWIDEADLMGRPGHELRDALRAGVADGEGIEPALLPDQAREKLQRKIVSRGRPVEHRADRIRRHPGRPGRVRRNGRGNGIWITVRTGEPSARRRFECTERRILRSLVRLRCRRMRRRVRIGRGFYRIRRRFESRLNRHKNHGSRDRSRGQQSTHVDFPTIPL